MATVKPAARPFVKWVGGKARLVPEFIARGLIPTSFNTYYEPFLGGGALFFALQPPKAVLNDINRRLMFTYQTIKENPEVLLERLKALQAQYDSADPEAQKAMFLELRAAYNAITTANQESAALLIFLNKTCFNGMYRENSKGGFNVPFGRYKQPKIYDPDNIRALTTLLGDVQILSTSFQAAVATAQKGDFVYFDPPYHPLTATSSFTSYAGDDFGEDDQRALKATFDELDNKGCKVMMSNSNSAFIRELYPATKYRHEIIMAARSINSVASGRGKIEELVVLNY